MLVTPRLNIQEFSEVQYKEYCDEYGIPVEELKEIIENFQPREIETGILTGDLYNCLDNKIKVFEFCNYVRKVGIDKAFRHDFVRLGQYGVADNIEQVKEHYKKLIGYKTKKYCIQINFINNDVEQGGFRWHKNGQYIGKHEIQGEYLWDNKDIKYVITFNIYQLLD